MLCEFNPSPDAIKLQSYVGTLGMIIMYFLYGKELVMYLIVGKSGTCLFRKK